MLQTGICGLRWAIAYSSVALALAIGLMDGAIAQIVPDDTLGTEGSRVRNFGTADAIDQGAKRGANLFHSFREFNVGTGRSAYFLNPSNDIRNILARVTGNNRSEILGTLGILNLNGVTSNPNLFLINPNGIVFGPNARLDVGASFVGTTANAIGFGDRGWFSATNPENASPLLTIDPSVFLFNRIPAGGIVINSNAGTDLESGTLGLRVPDGQDLLLLGGNINVDGGQLNAFGGRVEIGAVAGAGTVRLNADHSFGFPATTPRANASLTNGSQVDVRLGSGGNIGITAGNIDISSGSFLLAGIRSGFGSPGSQAGNLTLNATDRIQIRQTSGIGNIVGTNATGNGGDLNITTSSLFITSGSQLGSLTYGQGNAGSVIIRASDRVSFDGTSADEQFLSSAFSTAEQGSVGRGGNVDISTNSLSLTNGAQLNASTSGQGNAGNVIIRASDRVSFDGMSASGQIKSKARSTVDQGGVGQGGNIVIATGSLSLTNGAQLQSSTSGQGSAGNVIIHATDYVSFDSGVAFSTVEQSGTGRGGNIDISTGSLSLTNGAQLQSSTSGQGSAGSVIIRTTDRAFFDGTNTAAFSRVEQRGVGRGGNVQISTGSLSVTNGAGLTASTFGIGDAGNVVIRASDRVSFDGTSANGQFSGATSGVEQGGIGQGGNVEIFTSSLSVTNGAQLQSSTFGQGNAGNVIIRTTGSVLVTNGAGISTETYGKGDAGDLTIRARNVIVRGSQLSTTTHGAGNAGNFTIWASNLVDLSGEDLKARNGNGIAGGLQAEVDNPATTGRGGNLTIHTRRLRVSDGSKVQVATFGQGNAGVLRIQANEIEVFDTPRYNFYATGIFAGVEGDPINNQTTPASGNGGRLYINTDRLTIRGGAVVSRTLGSGQAGTIRIHARDRIAVIAPPLASQDRSLLGVGVNRGATGNAGSLIIDTRQLVVRGGEVSASSTGQGRAGSLIIRATDSINLSGVTPRIVNANGQIVFPQQPASLSAQVDRTGTRPGGNLTIQTDRLTISDCAQITVSNEGSARAGNLSINARSVQLSDRARFTANTVSSRGGNINLAIADSLQLNNHSQISASTQTGQGGRLTLNGDRSPANVVSINGRSQISTAASRTRGMAGDLNLNAEALNINNSAITVSNPNGRAGNLTTTANVVALDNGTLTATTGTSQGNRGANIRLNDLDLLLLRNGSQIQTNATRSATGGNITLNSQFIAAAPLENSDITANAGTGDGGRVNITTQGIFGITAQPRLTPQSDITASSDQGVQGVVTINQPNVDPSRGLTELPTAPIDATTQIAAACPTNAQEADRFGSFIVSGRGGLPPNPIDLLSEDNILTEWVTLGEPGNVKAEVPLPDSSEAIVEAQGWVKSENGEIQLVAAPKNSSTSALNSENCRSVSNP